MRDRPDLSSAPVSRVRGYWQGLGLRAATAVALVCAVAALALPGRSGEVLASVAVAVVVAAPLVRVVWLIIRWAQDRDWRFVAAGLTLLAVVGAGAALALV